MYKRPRPLLPHIQPSPKVLDSKEVNWSAWQMAPVGKIQEEEAAKEAAAARVVDLAAQRRAQQAAMLEALKEQARQEGYAAGFAQGSAEGFEKGKAEGHEQGYAQGKQLADQVRDEAVDRITALLSRTEGEILEFQELMGQAIIKMGTRVAGHILKTELAHSTKSVEAIVRKVIADHEDAEGVVTVYLNEKDLTLVQAAIEPRRPGRKPAAAADSQSGVRFVAADDLAPGDVRFKTPYGEIDATLAKRWNNAMASIGLDTPMSELK